MFNRTEAHGFPLVLVADVDNSKWYLLYARGHALAVPKVVQFEDLTEAILHSRTYDIFGPVPSPYELLMKKFPPADPDVKQDANRWRAIINSPRMTWMGAAGFNADKTAPKSEDPDEPNLHLTINFWTDHDDENPDDLARTMLTTLADALIAKEEQRELSDPANDPIGYAIWEENHRVAEDEPDEMAGLGSTIMGSIGKW